jgi:hypothetical protein
MFLVLCSVTVLSAAYLNGRTREVVGAAGIVLMPVVVGMIVVGFILTHTSVPGHSFSRTVFALVVLGATLIGTGLLTWTFGRMRHQKVGSGDALEPPRSAGTRKPPTTQDLTFFTVLLALAMVESLFVVGPIYQRPVRNTAFIEAQAAAVAQRAVSGRHTAPHRSEVMRAMGYVNRTHYTNPSSLHVVRSMGWTGYTISNTQDYARACFTFSRTRYFISAGPCVAPTP